jgi:hypothetical protein
MKLKGKDLEFISWIKRDGSGTDKIGDELIDIMQESNFEVNSLSLSFNTYVATDRMNWFVVKLKNGKQQF